MSYIIPVKPVAEYAVAFQLVEGETTATQLRAFSPGISVGHYESDERALVYVTVRTPAGAVDAAFGDWIVKDALGNLAVLPGDAFLRLYTPADEEASLTLRARDINDPRVQEASRVAKAFAQSLRAG